MAQNLKSWLAVNMVEGIGPVRLRKLLDEHGTIEQVCEVTGASLSLAEQEMARAGQLNTSLLCLADDRYPELLKNIYDPPPILYSRGLDLEPAAKAIAIVGTRRASLYGKETARRLAFELAGRGFTIVSGLALGIDTEAHKGALEAGGKTVAVFGTGVDKVYPASNRQLAKEIEASGSLVSEFPLGTWTEKGHFPRRNRIISGLSLGTIVVEGHYDSGAMITAKQALDQGREVFAVPGQVGLDQSKGPHWLIKQGAKLIESVDDVLEEFNMIGEDSRKQTAERRAQELSELSEEERGIVAVLSHEAKNIDVISAESGLPVAQTLGLLMMLEVKRIVRQQPGKMFVLS